MENNELVSIIIPCYNQAQYLKESVQSALDQTYPNIEIIIINDGSSDNTEEIALNLQEKHSEKIRVISQKNSGVSESRNNAIRKALGAYILPLDADDWINENMISQCMDTMMEKNADIVYADVQCFGVKKYLINKKSFSENNILYENLPHNVSLYRKKVWEKTNGYKNNMGEGYEDWEFWINAYKHNFIFCHISEALIHYRTALASRDIDAFQDHHKLLISKIVINNAELYTEEQIQKAIKYINKAKLLPDLYFYSLEELPVDKVSLTTAISHYLTSSELQEGQLITIPDTDKKFGLYSLETIDILQNSSDTMALASSNGEAKASLPSFARTLIENCNQLKKPYREREVDFILFYAPLRYEILTLKNLDFAWDKDKGMIEARGTIFPFVFKSKREDIKSQLIAHQREVQYLKYKFKKDDESSKKKLDSLNHKQNKIRNLKKMLDIKKPQEIIFLIPTCEKYSNKTETVRETWAKQLETFGFKYFFLMGNSELKVSEVNDDILYVPCRDDYESLLLKLVLGYEFLYNSMNFKYVYKIDDDCYPNLEKLVEEILPQLGSEQYLGGATHPKNTNMNNKWHFDKCSDPKFDQPYKFDIAPFEFAKGGYGYFLHKDILPLLFKFKNELRSELDRHIYSYEDVRMAEILEKHGILVSALKNYSIISGFNYNNSNNYLVYDIQNSGLMKLIERQRLKSEDSLPRDNILNNYFDHIYVINLDFKIADKLIIAEHLNKHGIDFEIFEATNGFIGEPLEKFEEFKKQELGTLKRYPQYNEMEKERGRRYIESAGAMGYIYTYLRLLRDAKKRGYKRFLILEDDILLSNNFEDEFNKFIQNIDDDWKILQLGASQYGWSSVNIDDAVKKRFYFPRIIDTCGSFAIAFDTSIIDELIEAESAFEAPFDHLPMGELYERYLGKCFVAYPNIVMPDVSQSYIRGKRSQQTHSKRMKWKLENFDYPLIKPSISIVISSKENLKYYSNFSKTKELPFNLRLYFNSTDGLRFLHSVELLYAPENSILPLGEEIFIPESDYQVTMESDVILTESDMVKYIEYKTGIQKENTTPLKELKVQRRKIKRERVSVIIPTYKRPKNLKNSLDSVVAQDYPDIEIIVVSDNGKYSELNEKTREIVASFDKQYDNCSIVMLEHSTNRNGAAARNTGILNSTGEYICFLDDDDTYLPGRLSKSIAKLKTTNKTTAAVYCGYLGWNSKENDLSRYKTGDLTREILLLDYKKHYLHTNTATYRREAVLTLNGFDESYRRHQDLEFNLRYFEHYTIETVKEHLALFTPGSTNVDNIVYDLNFMRIKEKFLTQFEHTIQQYDPKIQKQIYNKHWMSVKKHIPNVNDFITKVNKDPKEGLFHILKDSYYCDPRYEAIDGKYKLIMKSISNLIRTPMKTKPLQKRNAYKLLKENYYKSRKS